MTSTCSDGRIIKVGKNAWCLAKASRARVLIDGDRFYSALAESLALAQAEVFILGWDIDSRMTLPVSASLRAALDLQAQADEGVSLGVFLDALLQRRPRLQINILSWSFPLIYYFEREASSRWSFTRLKNFHRIKFVLDHHHPPFGSHHQKIVVIDDQIAFSGGLDLTQRRWDTSEHCGFDPRRVDPGGHAYGPFHDVQLMVNGPVARRLGQIARERWFYATGEKGSARLIELASSLDEVWPETVPFDFVDQEWAISRTVPPRLDAMKRRPLRSIYEVEKLFVDSIRSARRLIYIENQYLTSKRVALELAERLEEREGPEVIVILPRDQTGWIEEGTMGLLRHQALRWIYERDRYDRFRACYPVVEGLGPGYVKIHSKVMIVDDEFLRVGSANMNNRSLGLDSECDLSIEACGEAQTKERIVSIRDELLSEHLGVPPEIFRQTVAREGDSWVRALDRLKGGPRTVASLRPPQFSWADALLPPAEWVDPPRAWWIRRLLTKRIRSLLKPWIAPSQVAQLQNRFVLFAVMLFLILGWMSVSALALERAPDGPILGFLPDFAPGFGASESARSFSELCPGVKILGGSRFSFEPMETRLLCGDPEADEIGRPWAKIPPSQAAYFLKAFLQARGFHEPNFKQDGETLFADPGLESRIKNLKVTNGPSTWSPPRRRFIESELMTPKRLDELEAWAVAQIKNEGYACATARAQGRIDDGTVDVRLADVERPRFISGFEDHGDTGLRPGVLDRYNAFNIGDLYRDDLIALTRRRTADDGFLQSYSLSPQCEGESGVRIHRGVVLGPSRAVRIAVGASTDLGARFRGVLRRNRIGDSASSAQLRIQASYLNPQINREAIDANFRWYYDAVQSRSYVEPSVLYEHTAESAYDLRTSEGRLMHGWNVETVHGQLELRLGPAFLRSELARGLGPAAIDLVFAEINTRLMSHDFEFFNTSPRGGGRVDVTVLMTQKRWGANFTAEKVQVQAQKLWNMIPTDPPLLLLGVRGNASSVFSADEEISTDLPLRFLSFLGGEQDLRGYDRASLPRSGRGSLSAVSVGGEARLHKVLWRRLDFFVFSDLGLLGGVGFALKQPSFFSPGAGLRWESPIGVFRTYLAWRQALNQDPEAEPYDRAMRWGLTYGEEF